MFFFLNSFLFRNISVISEFVVDKRLKFSVPYLIQIFSAEVKEYLI